MESKKRVLIAGIGQSNFLKQLYSSIQEVKPNFYEFDIYGLKELSGKDEYEKKVFNKIYEVRKKILFKDIINLFDTKLIMLSFQFIRYRIDPKTLLNFIESYIITKSLYKESKMYNYDIIHIHFPSFKYLPIFWHIKDNVKCVVSFWGSDLMRLNGVFNYYIQSVVLKRADIITTHGNEMKQQILTKFGRNLDSKIYFTRFPPHDFFYNLIEEKLCQPKESFRNFLNNLNVPISKKISVIGHSGHPGNNHLKIISSLKGLPEEIKNDSFFILPFSYGQSKDGFYEAECQLALENAGLKGILLKTFLSWEDLATFKCITDIMIHMPISDALSGAMTEALYSGTKVITGDWLPYSPFIQEGLLFESTNFESLNHTFLKAFNTLPEKNDVITKNKEIIKNKFLSDYCSKTWLPVLN